MREHRILYNIATMLAAYFERHPDSRDARIGRSRALRRHPIGELYLAPGEPAGAEQQHAVPEEICLIPCAEYNDLKRAIAIYRRLVAR